MISQEISNPGGPSQTMQLNVNNTSNNNTLNDRGNLAGGESNCQPFSAGPVSCFVVEHNSFIEVRDCFIKSIKDKKNFD